MYGILDDTMKLRCFKNAITIESLAIIHLKKTMKAEGFLFNDKGRAEYIDSWVEHYNEMAEENGESAENTAAGVVDSVADHLTRCNVHFINCDTNCQITCAELEELERVILHKLESCLI